MVRSDVWKSSEVYRLVNLLQRESQSAAEVLDYLPLGIAVIQADGRITVSNRAYAGMVGAEALIADRQLQRVVTDVVNAKSAREDVRIGSYRGTLLPFGPDSALAVIDPRDAAPTTVLVGMLEAMDLPACLVSEDGVIRASNTQLLSLMGAQADDLIGAPMSQLHGSRSYGGAEACGSPQSTVLTKTGELLPVTRTLTPLHGHSSAWSVLTIKSASKAAPPAEVDSLASMEFVSGRMAHFLNNWLMIVLSATESLNKQFGSIDALRTDLEFIADSTNRASGVARDLLAFSACRPSMTVLQAVDEGLTGMAPLLRTLVGERNLVIRTGATNAHIRLAAAEFESIMAKLVQNAVDATPVNGEITIETARLNPEYPLQQRMLEEYGLAMTPHIRIRLEDNGRGIPAEHRKSVFKPFFTTRPGSLGLGLSAVHGIVKRAAGTVTFESEIGKGATFDVLVPESTCNANS